MYQIKAIKSSRDDVYKTPEQKKYIMPAPGTLLIVGSTGSGKTTVVANLLMNKKMLNGYFDKIYLFCLTPCDALTDNIDIDGKYDDDIEKLEELYNRNKSYIETNGFEEAPHVLFILDDIVNSSKFMNSKILSAIFFGGTHHKTSLWLLSQNYMSIPRRLRMNAHGLIICHGINNTEKTRFANEWQSPYLKKNEFLQLVNFALAKPYSFMFVNATVSNKKEMYRLCFDTILIID